MYADDLALVAPSVTKLHEMIQIFDDAMSKGGMELSEDHGGQRSNGAIRRPPDGSTRDDRDSA